MGNGAQQDKPAADAKKPAGTDAQDAADAAAKDGGTPTGNSGKEKQGEAGKEASKQDAEKSGANEIAPLAAGGADAPYVFWTVKDAGGSLVGGATFTIQGPRDNNYGQDSNNNRWNDNSREVTDCQTAPNACPAGNRDLDPDPGEYLVKYMSSNGTGTPISADRSRWLHVVHIFGMAACSRQQADSRSRSLGGKYLRLRQFPSSEGAARLVVCSRLCICNQHGRAVAADRAGWHDYCQGQLCRSNIHERFGDWWRWPASLCD